MSQPVLQLQNADNWHFLWTTYAESTKLPNGNTIPIPPIVIPFLLETNIIAIYATSSTAKRTWKIAGNVTKKISTGITIPGDSLDATISDIRLLRLRQINVFRFQRLTDTYGLEITPKYWIDDLGLSVWIYTGLDTDTISEHLDRIQTIVERL